jgi:ATP-binding cassette, subfamily B, bacterial
MSRVRYTDLALYRRLLRQAAPYWPQILGSLLLSLLSTPVAVLTPLPLKIAVDSVIGSHPIPGFLDSMLPDAAARTGVTVLVLAAGLVVALALLAQIRGLASWLLDTYTGERLVLAFRAQLFRHLQRLSLTYHDSKGTTDSLYRIQYDAPAIQFIAINGVIPFITAGFSLTAMIWVITLIDWQLALIALAVSPLLFMLTGYYRGRLRSRWTEVKQLQSTAMSVVHEVLASVRVVKAFVQEDREHDRFLRIASKGMRGQLRVAMTQGGFELLVGLTIATGTAAALFTGVRHVQAGVLTLGELLMVMAYLAQLYGPLETISKKVADIQASLASAERAYALLDEAPDVVERPHAMSLERANGHIAFRNVHFAYNADHPVLHDISFEVGPGTRVGVAGTTGAGKTTLVSLMTRFYDPTEGEILLDGQDLLDYKLTDLRNQFAIVLQEPVLFSTSIHENIAYARPGASDEDILAAAKAANAHEFITGLPQGYETQVGERGMRLSGGERQRISLARAFLKDAPILVLDEPTSSVDTKTEAVIMEAMERLMRGRTTFIIAHRLGTLRSCDMLLVLENGRLSPATSPASKAVLAAVSRREPSLYQGLAQA